MEKLRASFTLILFLIACLVSSRRHDDKNMAKSQLLFKEAAKMTKKTTWKEGIKINTTPTSNSKLEEFKTNKTVVPKKFKGVTKPTNVTKTARRKMITIKPKTPKTKSGVVDAIRGTMGWINRWFIDLYENRYPESTIVIKFDNYVNPERSFISLCPSQHRIRFKARCAGAFSLYLMENVIGHSNYHDRDETLVSIPDNTIRITIGKTTVNDVEDFIVAVKSWPPVKIGPFKYSREAKYHKRYQSLDKKTFYGYWLWWDQNGLIMLGREGEPPFLSHFQNPSGYPRILGFSNAFKSYAETEDINSTFVVQIQHPHGTKDCNCPPTDAKSFGMKGEKGEDPFLFASTHN